MPSFFTQSAFLMPFSADRTYRGYAPLLRLVPRLKTLLEDDSADIGDLDKLIALVRQHLSLPLCPSALADHGFSSRRELMMRVVMMFAGSRRRWVIGSMPTSPLLCPSYASLVLGVVSRTTSVAAFFAQLIITGMMRGK